MQSTELKNYHTKRAHMYTNLAYLLADVIHTYSLEIEISLKQIGFDLKKDEKAKINSLLVQARRLKMLSKSLSSPIYKIEAAEMACNDSDWLAEILLLLMDRVGENDEKAIIAKSMIFNMKSELNTLK